MAALSFVFRAFSGFFLLLYLLLGFALLLVVIVFLYKNAMSLSELLRLLVLLFSLALSADLLYLIRVVAQFASCQ